MQESFRSGPSGGRDVRHLAGDRAFFVRGVDHGWLLPQCSAVVHHGGAGTTASLEAGVPTVICSVFADQPFWGERVKRLGVGTHLPFAKLSPTRLEAALREVDDEGVQQRAAALGQKLRAEDGTTVAVNALLGHLRARRA